MSQADVPRRPIRPEPQAWPIVELSGADLRLEDEESPSPRRSDETGPVPVVAQRVSVGTGDGARVAGWSAGIAALLALIDKAASGTGLTANDLVEHLGPALGVVYLASPIVAAIAVVGWLVLRGYRKEQAAHRRRDRRLQGALVAFGRGIRDEIGMLRGDVAGFAAALDSVKVDVEKKIGDAVTVAARNQEARADRTDQAIAELRRGQAQLETRIVAVEIRPPSEVRVDVDAHTDAPSLRRKPVRGGGR